MDKEYWEKYYAGLGPSQQPSEFARFCAEKYENSFGRLFDIGCGNGRDSFFFSTQSIPCTGIEQCQMAIENNERNKIKLGLNTDFIQADFSVCDYDSLAKGGPFSIYSRFTLHAIDYKEERRLLYHLNKVKNLKHLFIEARSLRDSLYGQGKNIGPHEFVTSHYRRFIDPNILKSMIEDNFEIYYFEESQGFAKTKTDDPCLIRMLAKRR